MGSGELSAIEVFFKGGPVMWPILLCSLVALKIALERIFYFSSLKTDIVKLKTDVLDLLKQDQIREALDLCESNHSPVAKILKAGILKFGSSREEIKETIADVRAFEIPKLEKHLNLLATIAQLSTLLGLLGTVAGMCATFFSLEQRSRTMAPIMLTDISAGIWQSLLTTVAGLLVATLTYVTCQYFRSLVNIFIVEMERAANEITSFLAHLSTSQELRE